MAQSYDEFLTQLREQCAVDRKPNASTTATSASDGDKARVKPPASVYEELSFDFPLVSAEVLIVDVLWCVYLSPVS